MEQVAVVLVDPDPAGLHHGSSLAAMLGCRLLLYRGLPQLDLRAVVQELRAVEPRVALLETARSNRSQVLKVCRLLPPGTLRVLFGQALADRELRASVGPQDADGLLPGEPHLTARVLVRQVTTGGGLADLPGLVLLKRSERYVPREPLRNLDLVPPGDYRGFEREVALQLPMHVSRSHPHACPGSARRAWETPVRRMTVQRVLADLELHVSRHDVRHILFADRCLNTSTGWLLELCRGIVERGLDQLRWHGRVRADPLLDRDAVHLLRCSGCRGLQIDLYTGSPWLNRELGTGVDPHLVGQLVRECHAEGIDARVDLVVGLPGEEDRDRIATMSWLEGNADRLRGLSSLDVCVLRDGAPLRRDPRVHLQGEDGAGWHDGGSNNASQRVTWRRELAHWVDHVGLRRPAGCGGYSGSRGQAVIGRLMGGAHSAQASDPAWRREHLLEAGILHGREAFCGPTILDLELDQMATDDALQILKQVAATGTRRVVLGGEGDVVGHEGLPRLLAQARRLGLLATLRTRADGLKDADLLRRVGQSVWQVEVEALTKADLQAAARWIPVLTSRRAELQLPLPQVVLRVCLERDHADADAAISCALDCGVDQISLDIARGERQRMSEQQRTDVRAAVLRSLAGALLDDGFARNPEQWPAQADAHLIPVAGWPAGFCLARDAEAPVLTCPAGACSSVIRRPRADPGCRLAVFDRQICRACDLLTGCPVDRVGFVVRLPLTRLGRPAFLLSGLASSDSGLGERARWLEQSPCLVGWDEARIDGAGRLFVCPRCGSEPVGNVLEAGFPSLWYGRALNDFRHMARGAGKSLPHVERSRCATVCDRLMRDAQLASELEALDPARREALASVGAAERLGAVGS